MDLVLFYLDLFFTFPEESIKFLKDFLNFVYKRVLKYKFKLFLKFLYCYSLNRIKTDPFYLKNTDLFFDISNDDLF